MIRRLLLAALLCLGVAGSEAHELGLSLHLGDVAASSKAAAAFSTLDPATLGAGVTLSNGNRTVTGNSPASDSGAFSATSLSAGKVYFEITANTATTLDTGTGVGTAAATFPSAILNPTNAVIAYRDGTCFLNSAPQGTLTTAWSLGDVIGIAVDLTNGNFAARNITQGDNWNKNGANNPATGGVNIGALTGALRVVVGIASGSTQAQTFNPGSSAFVGTIPAGYSAWH